MLVSITPASLLGERRDIDFVVNNYVTLFYFGDFDARLLCSGICLDVDDILSVCQCHTGHEGDDHENSHQHAQQSLFHFLLFTSVKIVG